MDRTAEKSGGLMKIDDQIQKLQMEIEDRTRTAKARLRAILEKIGQTKN